METNEIWPMSNSSKKSNWNKYKATSPRNNNQKQTSNLILWGKNINRTAGSKSVVTNGGESNHTRRASRGGAVPN